MRDDLDTVVEIHHLPSNWLQCMDNAADPVHFSKAFASRYDNYFGKIEAFADVRGR